MLNERESAALGALLRVREMIVDVLPHFNWGASCLSAHDIHILNEVPFAVYDAIEKLTKDSP
jgi:hypothetical protein